nr:MAG TPA: hypothetical protein [Caudoviricetes sp.]
MLTSFSKHHQIYLEINILANATSLVEACSVWKAGHTYTSPKPGQMTGLFVLEKK